MIDMGRSEGYDDKFFSTPKCDRCGSFLEGQARTMSWFNEDTICTGGSNSCQFKEEKIKTAIRNRGEDTRNYEGCGYLPTVNNSKDFITEE